MTGGCVYLVGAGPGDPGLLTIRGKEILEKAQVLIYDSLVSEELLSLTPEDCERIFVGKRAGHHSHSQQEINALLIEKAKQGACVVRLKGGDPYVFGRGGEEVLALQKAQLPYQVIPGVSSATAAAASAGIPLTHREMSCSFHVITGHTAQGGLEAELLRQLAGLEGTLVFLMGIETLEEICRGLMRYGKSGQTPAAVVSHATLPNQTCLRAPLGEIALYAREHGAEAPGILLVGETAGMQLESTIPWLPRERITAGLFGTEVFCRKLEKQLSLRGIVTQQMGLMEVVPQKKEELAAEIWRLKQYTWVIFTSQNGVELFFETAMENGADARAMSHLKFAVIGPATAEVLRHYGYFADCMPAAYTVEALADCLRVRLTRTDLVLIPRARQGNLMLTESLRARGIPYRELAVYDVRPMERTTWEQAPDYFVFASGSGVRGFLEKDTEERLQMLCLQTVPVCIGEATGKVLAEYGIYRMLISEICTAEGVAETIEEDIRRQREAAQEQPAGKKHRKL